MRWLPYTPHRVRAAEWLTATPFAHRGLHGADRPENSKAAFRAAIAAGMGIELDVRACRGGAAMVFHDERLERMCNAVGPISGLDVAALTLVRLKGSEEGIAGIEEVLALIGGRVPVLIELKAPALRVSALCRSVASALDRYNGPAAIMSFSTLAVAWFRRCAPQIIRGLVISEGEGPKSFVIQHLALAAVRPDFLAYDIRNLPSRFAAAARTRGLPILAWTVRDAQDREQARRHADQIIHELPVL